MQCYRWLHSRQFKATYTFQFCFRLTEWLQNNRETKHYKEINKSVLNTITFYLEDDNNEAGVFNGETLILHYK